VTSRLRAFAVTVENMASDETANCDDLLEKRLQLERQVTQHARLAPDKGPRRPLDRRS
jgi:hypothetical protein